MKFLLFLFGLVLFTACETTKVPSNVRVIVPQTYNGICVIGFSNEPIKGNEIDVFIDTNGVGIMEGKITEFLKNSNVDYGYFEDTSFHLTSSTHYQKGFDFQYKNEKYYIFGVSKDTIRIGEKIIIDPKQIEEKVLLLKKKLR